MSNTRTRLERRAVGPGAAERLSAEPGRGAAGRRVVTGPGWMRLSRGMLIQAVIEARLLGKRLLTLNAEIMVLPAEGSGGREPRGAAPPHRGESPGRGRVNSTGRGLAAAARSLEAGSDELRVARDALP